MNNNKGNKLDKLSRKYERLSDKELVKAYFSRRLLGKEEAEVLSKAMHARRIRNGGFL